MPLYVMATELSANRQSDPKTLELLEKQVEEKIEEICPDIEWIGNYALFGPYNYLDIFYVPDAETAMKVVTLVRSFGHGRTELWPATDWSNFKSIVRSMPRAAV